MTNESARVLFSPLFAPTEEEPVLAWNGKRVIFLELPNMSENVEESQTSQASSSSSSSLQVGSFQTRLLLSCLVLPCLALSRLVLPCLVLFSLAMSWLLLSSLVFSCFLRSSLRLYCLALPCLASCLALPFALSALAFLCLLLSSLVCSRLL